MPKIPLSEGHHLFGNDPLAYANGRPDYPEELYQRLRIRCELGPGISAFEIWSWDWPGHSAIARIGRVAIVGDR